VYLRRDGKTERTVTMAWLGRCLEVWHRDHIDVYDFTEVMPTTREIFADFSGMRALRG
jgi:hypothetical protein